MIIPRLGYSPFFLQTGAHPVLPAAQFDSNIKDAPTTTAQLVKTVSDSLEKVRIQQLQSHLKNREAYKKRSTLRKFKQAQWSTYGIPRRKRTENSPPTSTVPTKS
ncbi:Hypothetical protein FKW44_007295 [Caligus rogercresseyi]|uniref:Uncharacterized protein n=1 Tax=Caligus rogercresseyi TaxID=217165 RepID=A0A7T8KEV1_CALRO|nr:Hypothetical protein FKW44_007295 [Caligus rogercresseyi]